MNTSQQSPVIARYPQNNEGRDFVVGDIHGAYTLLLQAMKTVRFDPKVDRLFSVGDLIDRGPESARVARFLAQPYVHAVRGNHEEMLMEIYQDGEPDPAVLAWHAQHNGFDWWLDTPPESRVEILAAVRKLPIAIEVESARGTVGIVHAEVPPGLSWPEFLDKLESGDQRATQTAMWGRDRIKRDNHDGVAGVGRVFVGHTIQWGGINRLGNVYAVDTGAIFADMNKMEGSMLTMMNILHSTAVSLTGQQEGQDELLNVLNVPASGPFGKYARP